MILHLWLCRIPLGRFHWQLHRALCVLTGHGWVEDRRDACVFCRKPLPEEGR